MVCVAKANPWGESCGLTLAHMPWTISWLGATRASLKSLGSERFKGLTSVDVGEALIEKVEDEIRLHPLPAADLPQVTEAQLLSLGPIQIAYYLDSQSGEAQVRSVSLC